MHYMFYLVNLHTSRLFHPLSIYHDPSIGVDGLPTDTAAIHTRQEHKTARNFAWLAGSTHWR